MTKSIIWNEPAIHWTKKKDQIDLWKIKEKIHDLRFYESFSIDPTFCFSREKFTSFLQQTNVWWLPNLADWFTKAFPFSGYISANSEYITNFTIETQWEIDLDDNRKGSKVAGTNHNATLIYWIFLASSSDWFEINNTYLSHAMVGPFMLVN